MVMKFLLGVMEISKIRKQWLAAQFLDYNENNWTINFKWWNCTVYEFYVNKDIFKMSMRPGRKQTKMFKVNHFILFPHIQPETLAISIFFSVIC